MKKSDVILVVLVVGLITAIAVKEARKSQPVAQPADAAAASRPSAEAASTPAQRALAQAMEERKPVLLSFRSSSCIPCKAMAEVVAELRPKFSDRVAFVDVSLDGLSEIRLIEEYQIRVKPTTILLSPQGDVLDSRMGVWPAEELGARLQEVLRR